MLKKYLPFVVIFLMGAIAYFIVANSGQEPEVGNKPPADKEEIEQFKQFLGEKGEKVLLNNGQVELRSETLSDGLVHYYNVDLPEGKTVYFFAVKDKNGIYRAAANACQVCFGTRMGFHQDGNFMVCDTCGNKYPLEKIATEKGGCNPGPINPNLEVEDGKIVINQSELEQVADLF